MVGSKHSFWQALVFTVIIFAIGLVIGYYIETSRSSAVGNLVLNSEVNLMDEQVRDGAVSLFNVSCNLSVSGLFSFADKIYSEALLLEEYDSASKLTSDLQLLHRRYDLLRFSLWSESINLKNRCPSNYHTLVYFYNYKTDNLDQKAEQNLYSRLLTDIKDKYPSKILLIPMAVNLNLSSINLVLEQKNIRTIPSILVDENKLVNTTITLNEFEKVIFG